MIGEMTMAEACVFSIDDANLAFQWIDPDALVEVYAINKETMQVIRVCNVQQAVEFFNNKESSDEGK